MFNPPLVIGSCDHCNETDFKKRADDNEDTVISRLEAYHNQTSPLAEWYKSKGILCEIDGDRNIEEITQDILEALN